MTVDDELLPSNSSISSIRSSIGLFVVVMVVVVVFDDRTAGRDDAMAVVGSSSPLNKNEPVELTPLELCTLRNEFVLLNSLVGIVVERSDFVDGSFVHDKRLIIAVDLLDDGLIDVVDGLLLCVTLVPSAVKNRPKFFGSLREFRRVSTSLLESDSILNDC